MKFEEFAELVATTAKNQHKDSIVQGLMVKGPDYSLTEDMENDKLDSLDVTETIMSLEELIQAKPGFEKVKLEGDEFEKASNMRELYTYVCKAVGIEPVFLPTAPPLRVAPHH